MNKLLTIFALVVTSQYSFAAAEKTITPKTPVEGKPAVVLQVLDVSGKAAKPIKGNKLSISKKQTQLCWYSINVPTQNKVMIAEAFYAPAEMKLASPGSRVDSSEDGKNHTIITEVNLVNNQPLSRCWGFDKTDPVGKYKMEVQINNQIFKGLEFEIVK
ncbi:hypothetical protein CT138_06480 [Mannheimia varigena]|uniref:hypothetical protein n=1 Tax=Mannheimia varigena TaxID=85404 RepID=UPI0003E37E07|nr:hypothetical protein [Mannheimia varigena]AHG77463.1 hypothetical protein X874_8270 [Mannheimia varigena USDA-ARS-USMARC-1312]AWW34521.1 hypothetical protein CT138_06480 [Mannheimia varigena]